MPAKLPITRVHAGAHWLRIHGWRRKALWFGAATARIPIHRFDDPLGAFGVCYLGTKVEVCFAETFLWNAPVEILSLDDLAIRSVTTVEVIRDLRLVPLHGASLGKLRATTELTSGSDYRMSQTWSRALWEHSDGIDGVIYRSRHDDSAFCNAIYDRARSGLKALSGRSLDEDPQLLARLLKRYDLGLTR